MKKESKTFIALYLCFCAALSTFVAFTIDAKVLTEMVKGYSQMCVTVLFGLSALVVAIVAVRNNKTNFKIKKDLLSLVWLISSASITSIVLYLFTFTNQNFFLGLKLLFIPSAVTLGMAIFQLYIFTEKILKD